MKAFRRVGSEHPWSTGTAQAAGAVRSVRSHDVLPGGQRCVERPADKLGLGDAEFPGPRFERPILTLLEVELFSDHAYIVYIAFG